MAHRDGENSEQTSEEPTPGWGDSPYTLKNFRGRDGASLRKSRRLKAMRRRVEDIEDVPAENPSPFYSLFEGATKAVLGFPADDDFIGPFWNELGELDTTRGSGWSEEKVAVVALGGNRYRLAVCMDGPFSSLRLYWGDEFMAEPAGGNKLTLHSVVVPQRFTHFRFMVSGFGSQHPLAEQVHAMGGGWELVAQGILTLTVAAEHAAEFEHRMHEQGLAPGVLSLEV